MKLFKLCKKNKNIFIFYGYDNVREIDVSLRKFLFLLEESRVKRLEYIKIVVKVGRDFTQNLRRKYDGETL